MKKIKSKKLRAISKEWDNVSEQRFNQINSGLDTSYNNIIVPNIISLLKTCDLSNVLDCGCGVGFLTKKIINLCKDIVGIDISKKNVEIALENHTLEGVPKFINIDLHSFSKDNATKFSTCIVNMVLMNILELPQALNDINKLLKHKGNLLISIIHPCFWPTYWKYFNAEWFNYFEEIVIEADFSISKEKSIGKTTHVHRSLSKYFNALVEAGFFIEEIIESKNNDSFYPRFLFIKCKKEY